jgi:hypothetical protein
MKKIISTILLVFIMSINLLAQNHNNVKILPKQDTVCFGTTASLWTAGNSFIPISYLWSNGETTPTISINYSGTYTLTVTGYLGQSNQQVIINKSKNFIVLDKPKINPLTPIWVCKFDTVKLEADAGYNNYLWMNGTTNQIFSRQMTGSGGGPILDTVSVWYTASINNLCQVNSDTVVIRGIRLPNGVGVNYEGRTNLNLTDSVPAGLVLTYIYTPQYEMEFTKVNDPNYVVTWITPTTSRKAPLNILDPGNNYYVRTRPIINGITYCWGSNSLIGILPSPSNRISLDNVDNDNSIKNFQFYDLSGRLIFEKQDFQFNDQWLNDYPNQTFIVIDKNNIQGGYKLKMNLR